MTPSLYHLTSAGRCDSVAVTVGQCRNWLVVNAVEPRRILDLPAQDDARLGPSGLSPKLFYPERDSFYPLHCAVRVGRGNRVCRPTFEGMESERATNRLNKSHHHQAATEPSVRVANHWARMMLGDRRKRPTECQTTARAKVSPDYVGARLCSGSTPSRISINHEQETRSVSAIPDIGSLATAESASVQTRRIQVRQMRHLERPSWTSQEIPERPDEVHPR
jgi:hypothetical protein